MHARVSRIGCGGLRRGGGLLATVMLALAAAMELPAAVTSTWQGTTNSGWNVATNWVSGVVPGSNADTITRDTANFTRASRCR